MAVRHGYGKVAGTDALVFAYDTGDTKNSYKGEPTTNLVTNGNFSNGKTGWGFTGTANSATSVGTYQGKVALFANGLRYYNETPGYFYQSINLTQGVTYTVSFKYYLLSGTLIFDPDGAYNGGGGLTATGRWVTYSATFVASSTNVTLNFYGDSGVYTYYYITDIQLEQKSHATSFVNGTRSSTQGLLDLTGNRTIDISTVSFDSNAQPTLDGTDDTLSTGIPLTNFPALSNFSIECIVKIDSYPTAASPNGYGSTTKTGVLIGAAYYGGTALYWSGNSSGTACNIYAYIRGTDAYRTAGSYDLTPGRYHHLVLVNDYTGGTLNLYTNGVLNGSATGPTQEYNSSFTSTAGNIGISKAQVDGGGTAVYSYFQGNVPAVKLYSKALSADEVRNNYSLYKTRFNM
jgi:hypothetical protein